MSKIILITGSTDGIGKLAAIKLAKEGHELFLHGRNQSKLDAAIKYVKTESKNENVKGFIADFSDLGAVRHMGQQINEELSKIDVLINNAGVYNSTTSQNKDGWDIRFVVNYFAPYLLTNALIPLLKKGADSRIINLSSAGQSSVDYDILSGKAKGANKSTYAQSKLALTMWSFYLAKTEPNISVVAVNPGSLLNTKMVQEAFGNSWASAEKGGTILCELAISDDYKGVKGKYFDNDQGAIGKAHPDAYNVTAIDKLIDITNKVLVD